MTDRTEPIDEAIEEGDVTLAIPLPPLLLLAAGVLVGLRVLKSVRERRARQRVRAQQRMRAGVAHLVDRIRGEA